MYELYMMHTLTLTLYFYSGLEFWRYVLHKLPYLLLYLTQYSQWPALDYLL
jgi:hypothetical protein